MDEKKCGIAERIKDWYEKDRKLFKDNFNIDSYNLSQLDNYA